MYIAGDKFEEHYFNISRVILDCVLCCFSGTNCDVISFDTKLEFSKTQKDIPGKKKPFFFTLKSLSNKQQLFFYFIGTLTEQ